VLSCVLVGGVLFIELFCCSSPGLHGAGQVTRKKEEYEYGYDINRNSEKWWGL